MAELFDIPNLLDRLNYPITTRGKNCLCPTIYRGGNNPNGLFVNESGFCKDLVQDTVFSLTEFVKIVLGVSQKQAQEFIGSNQSSNFVEKEVKLESNEIFNISHIEGMTASYKFYLERGISKETLQDFRAGLIHSGKLYLRFTFPIFDKDGETVSGATGRCVRHSKEEERELGKDRPRPKWKILGKKSKFEYPLFISSEYIQKTRQIVIVESVGDAISLWNSGIKNIFVLFGMSISQSQIIAIMAENPKEIILALNNDFAGDKNRGKIGAAKLRAKLSKFYKATVIKDGFPTKNDFGDQSVEENKQWAQANKVQTF